MRSIPDFNFPAFHEVEKALREILGSEVTILNPANDFNGDPTRPVTDYMQVDLEQVLKADVIVLLPGWEASEGADRETKLAVWTGKRFMLACRQEKTGRWTFRELDGLPAKKSSPRADALEEAKGLITGDRNNAYGPPTQDFARTAGALNAYGYRGPNGRELRAHDVAIMIMAVKLSRLMWTPKKRDHWVDVAGYAGCGYECAITEEADNDS